MDSEQFSPTQGTLKLEEQEEGDFTAIKEDIWELWPKSDVIHTRLLEPHFLHIAWSLPSYPTFTSPGPVTDLP